MTDNGSKERTSLIAKRVAMGHRKNVRPVQMTPACHIQRLGPVTCLACMAWPGLYSSFTNFAHHLYSHSFPPNKEDKGRSALA